MFKLVVASNNPVKIGAALAGFRQMFPDQEYSAEGVSVPSGVSVQPMTDSETLQGAHNRAAAAKAAQPDADYWIGIEGGCDDVNGAVEVFAWVVVLNGAKEGKARTGMFYLPESVAALVRQGIELGHADDMVFGRSNSKQSDGSVGLLTGGLIDRAAYYTHAVILALIPFKNPELVFP